MTVARKVDCLVATKVGWKACCWDDLIRLVAKKAYYWDEKIHLVAKKVDCLVATKVG